MVQVSLLSRLEEHMTALSERPTARGLADAVSSVIREGQLREGEKLPPIRSVATQLGLSPTTVSSAWAMLQRAGMVSANGRNGTRIAPRQIGPLRYRSALGQGDALPVPPDDGARAHFTVDLSTGTPDPALLPDLAAALRRVQPPGGASSYLDEPVLPELAELLRADWPFPAERITVVDGAMDALDLIATTHVRFGDRVAVEDPCFAPLLDLLDAVGARVMPLRLDADGVAPADLRRAVDAGVRAVFLQPRGQNPTGISTTAARVAELAEILSGRDVLVVEDDSLGSIATSPDVSLGELLPQQTLHVRSYSKSHGPDLRLAALGGPQHLIAPIVDRRFLGQGWTSRLLQRVLVTLLTEPSAVAAVDRARAEYARRRRVVVSQLAAAGITVPGSDGLNIWVPVADETAALLLLATHGIGASSGRPFMVEDAGEPHVRITAGLIGADAAGDLDAAATAGVIAAAARAHRHPASR